MGEEQKLTVFCRGFPGLPALRPSWITRLMSAVGCDSWRPFAWPLAALTAGYLLLLLFATHYPRPEELLGPDPPSDKTLHFLAYGTLGFLAAATLAAAGRWSRQSVACLAVALAIFAALDELTQPAFGRTAEQLDWIFDLIGLTIGISLVAALTAMLGSSSVRPGGPS
jgi:VanZ family protein